ncbi:DUF3797 domain-containing protein [Bacillus pseudomycoides]|nr:hypothetical protein bmyco0003_27680 [Bacillus pseudomycoides]MBD5797661.1 DUF3797 domain-containing protein [Bacillus pseudomycoides]
MKVNVVSTLKLTRKYAECPECGNDKVGNGEGALEINDDIFKRTCKCGWNIEVKEN